MAPPLDFVTASGSGLPYSLINPLQNPNPLIPLRRRRRSISTAMSLKAKAKAKAKSSSRYAILGAGFAGLSVAWHLLKVNFLFTLPFRR